MKQFDRKPLHAASQAVELPSELQSDQRSERHSPPDTASAVCGLPELFRPFRSVQAIKEDQLEYLRAIADRHVGHSPGLHFVAETLQAAGCRSPTRRQSFRGTRGDVTIPENTHGRALASFIHDSLEKIFPPGVEDVTHRPVLSRSHDGTVDPRGRNTRLLYHPHDRAALELLIENVEQNTRGSRDAVTTRPLPMSPFADVSISNPPARSFHPPPGLPVVLNAIKKRKVLSVAVDPDSELKKSADPPMSDEAREDEARGCVVRSVQRCRRAARRLVPILEQADRLRTESEKLYKRSQANRRKFDFNNTERSGEYTSQRQVTAPSQVTSFWSPAGGASPLAASDAAASSAAPRRMKSLVSFGDFFSQ